MFRLDDTYIKETGSKVMCSKCQDVFMVFPPENNTEPCPKSNTSNASEAVEISNVRHSLLDDLFQRKNTPNELVASTGESKEPDNYSIEDFQEEEEDEETEYADLPDLSEIEETVNSILDENDYLKNFPPYIQAKYSLTPDLYSYGK
jgi:hypothetical protein